MAVRVTLKLKHPGPRTDHIFEQLGSRYGLIATAIEDSPHNLYAIVMVREDARAERATMATATLLDEIDRDWRDFITIVDSRDIPA